MKKYIYTLENTDSFARCGRITTDHGEIMTPAFMPVGTRATVKTLSPEEVDEVGANVILANTYHLYLRPGLEIIKNAGGIHNFMNWHKPVLTDSGGYQVFSLGAGAKESKMGLVKIFEDRVEFRSHLDGSKHSFSPEMVIEAERSLGADIIMCFDECAPHDSNYTYAKEAMKRTHSWANKCLNHHIKHNRKSVYGNNQALFGIIQGVLYDDLRTASAEYISSLDFEGIAIGGLSVGESKSEMHRILDKICPLLPKEKPRYLMGVGSPVDLLEGIERGIDMFDCVLPTRIARNGTVWTKFGKINLNNSGYRIDPWPIDDSCDCYACRHYSRSYISHLIQEKEVFGIRLTTIHNLRFILRLMEEAREAIEGGSFAAFKKNFLESFDSTSKKQNL